MISFGLLLAHTHTGILDSCRHLQITHTKKFNRCLQWLSGCLYNYAFLSYAAVFGAYRRRLGQPAQNSGETGAAALHKYGAKQRVSFERHIIYLGLRAISCIQMQWMHGSTTKISLIPTGSAVNIGTPALVLPCLLNDGLKLFYLALGAQ
jgi:hypothetical protein